MIITLKTFSAGFDLLFNF